MWFCNKRWIITTYKYFSFILFLIIILTMSGCDPVAGRYPPQISEKWVCTDPPITLIDIYDSDKNSELLDEWIEWNDTRVRIRVSYHVHFFWVSKYYDGFQTTDNLFCGTWKYESDKLVFTIEEDNFFGGAYKTLIFSRDE